MEKKDSLANSYASNKFHGQGIATLPDGTKYEGEWKDGEFVE